MSESSPAERRTQIEPLTAGGILRRNPPRPEILSRVDFGLNWQREILLFEASATMIAQQPDEGELWDYRCPAVERIHAAMRGKSMTNAAAGCHRSIRTER